MFINVIDTNGKCIEYEVGDWELNKDLDILALFDKGKNIIAYFNYNNLLGFEVKKC